MLVTSGGLSHFPGTERYASPSTEFDLKLMPHLAGVRDGSYTPADAEEKAHLARMCSLLRFTHRPPSKGEIFSLFVQSEKERDVLLILLTIDKCYWKK